MIHFKQIAGYLAIVISFSLLTIETSAQALSEQLQEIAQTPVDTSKVEDIANIAAQQRKQGLELLEGIPGFDAGRLSEAQQQQKPEMKADRIEIYVSSALGERLLDKIYSRAAGKEDVYLIFRGIEEGENMPLAFKRLYQLINKYDPPPNITINPKSYRDNDVTVSPEILLYKDDEVILRGKGMVSLPEFRQRMNDGQRGDLGVLGPTVSISEPDLVEVMKQRFANLDEDALITRARNNFFRKMEFSELPEATKTRAWRYRPEIIVSKDIITPNGEVLAYEGDLYNPLHKLPFHTRVIVFDPLKPWQIEVANRLLKQVQGLRPVTLIATRFNREGAFEGVKDLENQLGSPVYLLNKQFIDRFRFQVTPSMLEAEGEHFVITEIAEDTLNDNDH